MNLLELWERLKYFDHFFNFLSFRVLPVGSGALPPVLEGTDESKDFLEFDAADFASWSSSSGGPGLEKSEG